MRGGLWLNKHKRITPPLSKHAGHNYIHGGVIKTLWRVYLFRLSLFHWIFSPCWTSQPFICWDNSVMHCPQWVGNARECAQNKNGFRPYVRAMQQWNVCLPIYRLKSQTSAYNLAWLFSVWWVMSLSCIIPGRRFSGVYSFQSSPKSLLRRPPRPRSLRGAVFTSVQLWKETRGRTSPGCLRREDFWRIKQKSGTTPSVTLRGEPAVRIAASPQTPSAKTSVSCTSQFGVSWWN